jgi:hypothetical protein
MKKNLKILLLGVEGAGKTTYLYRLVTAWLEGRGHSAEELRGMSPDDFVLAAQKHGVKWTGPETEGFLTRVHQQVRDHGGPLSRSGSPDRPVTTVDLRFDDGHGEILQLYTDDVAGQIVAPACRLLEAGGGEADKTTIEFVTRIRDQIRRVDGVIFIHRPDRINVRAESEAAMRAFSAALLREGRAEFPPFVIVINRSGAMSHPAGTRRLLSDALRGDDDRSARNAGVEELSDVGVAATRDRLAEIYWQELNRRHEADLAHEFWRPLTDIFRAGGNIVELNTVEGSFAELRGPIDTVERLDRAAERFRSKSFRRSATTLAVGWFALAVVALISWALPALFIANERSIVPDFSEPQQLYTWLEAGDTEESSRTLEELDAALKQVGDELDTLELELDGATTSFTKQSFVRYDGWIRTIRPIESQNPAGLSATAGKIRLGVVSAITTWLNETQQSVEGYRSDAWFARVERYVDGLGPRFTGTQQQQIFDEWRRQWRDQRYRQLRDDLATLLAAGPAPANYYSQARNLTERFWLNYVQLAEANQLRYLRFSAPDPRWQRIRDAREFVIRATEGDLPMRLTVEKFVVNDPDQITDDPKVMTARLIDRLPDGGRPPREFGKDGLTTITLVSQGDAVPKVFRPDAANVSAALEFGYRPGDDLVVDVRYKPFETLDTMYSAFVVSLTAVAGGNPSLPGMSVEAFAAESTLRDPTKPRDLTFTLTQPLLPALLLGAPDAEAGATDAD